MGVRADASSGRRRGSSHRRGSSRRPATPQWPWVIAAISSLIEAADIQLKMEATGGELIEIPAEICEKTARQHEHHDSGRGSADWPAYLRMLNAIDPHWQT